MTPIRMVSDLTAGWGRNVPIESGFMIASWGGYYHQANCRRTDPSSCPLRRWRMPGRTPGLGLRDPADDITQRQGPLILRGVGRVWNEATPGVPFVRPYRGLS